MYYIMNKDKIIAEFDYVKNEFGTAVPRLVSGSLPELFGDMKLKNWLETRRSAKHRAEIAKILRSLDMTDLKSFIDVSMGLTLTDTLWVKEEHSDANWNSVNLYENNSMILFLRLLSLVEYQILVLKQLLLSMVLMECSLNAV